MRSDDVFVRRKTVDRGGDLRAFVESLMLLVTPSHEHLPSYIAALRRGWWFESPRPEDAESALGMAQNAPDEFLKRYGDP